VQFSFSFDIGSKRLGMIDDNSKMQMRRPKLKEACAAALGVREKSCPERRLILRLLIDKNPKSES